MPATVIINEQHSLMESQQALLEATVGNYVFLKAPAAGWTKEQIDEEVEKLGGVVVFVSPVPYMIKAATIAMCEGKIVDVLIMANDKREKKELPNGKVIHAVAKDGWYLA